MAFGESGEQLKHYYNFQQDACQWWKWMYSRMAIYGFPAKQYQIGYQHFSKPSRNYGNKAFILTNKQVIGLI